jgi:hypothetical protein
VNRRGAYALAAWITKIPVEQVAAKCGDKQAVICKQDGCERPVFWRSDYCIEHPSR